jgi:hypothetical protein
MTVLINSTATSLASPSSPTPEFSLEQRLKQIEIEDECWSPSPSLNDDEKKIEFLVPSKNILKSIDFKEDELNTTISFPASLPSPEDQQVNVIDDTLCNKKKMKSENFCKAKEATIPRFYYNKGEPNARRLACERNRERMVPRQDFLGFR